MACRCTSVDMPAAFSSELSSASNDAFHLTAGLAFARRGRST